MPLPADFDYQFKNTYVETRYPTPDGASLHTLLDSKTGSKGVVYFFQGGGGNLQHADFIANQWQPFGYDVLLWDYRQFGKSTGPVSQQAFYEDAALIYRALRTKYGERNIVLCGHSLGCAIAANVASKNHPAALILVEPFYNFITKTGTGSLPWYWPARTVYTFHTDEFVAKTTSPILILSGTKSELYGVGKKLLGLNPAHTTFISVPGAGHDDIFKFPAYRSGLQGFLR